MESAAWFGHRVPRDGAGVRGRLRSAPPDLPPARGGRARWHELAGWGEIVNARILPLGAPSLCSPFMKRRSRSRVRSGGPAPTPPPPTPGPVALAVTRRQRLARALLGLR